MGCGSVSSHRVTTPSFWPRDTIFISSSARLCDVQRAHAHIDCAVSSPPTWALSGDGAGNMLGRHTHAAFAVNPSRMPQGPYPDRPMSRSNRTFRPPPFRRFQVACAPITPALESQSSLHTAKNRSGGSGRCQLDSCQSLRHRISHEAGRVLDGQFPHEAASMPFDGLCAQRQFPGDRLGRFAVGD
jgi:hypothetical protein